MLQTVLKLDLRVWRETETGGEVDAPDIMPPLCRPCPVGNAIVELLVPAQCTEKARCNFIFGLEVIREGFGVTDPRNLETGGINFTPKLQVMPRKADIMCQHELPIIAPRSTRPQRRLRELAQIRTTTGGNSHVPHLVRLKSKPR